MHRTQTIVRSLLTAILVTGLVWPSTAGAVISTARLESVSFADSQHGYIAGGFAPDNGVVSHTADGGATWHARTYPSRWLYAVSADGSSAMASAGKYFDWLAASSNGGVDWNTINPVLNLSAGFEDVAYLSGGRRVAVGTWNDYALIASAVGGGGWSTDYYGPIYPPSGDTEAPTTHALFSAIDAAPGGTVAWAVGNDWTTQSAGGPYSALIRKTSDSGSTWTTQTVSGTTPEITSIAVADSTHAYVGRRGGTLLRTTDGANWAATPALPIGFTVVNAIDASDADHVVVVGDAGRVCYTSNATAATPTWTAKNVSTANALRGIEMLDATHWVVVGDNETIVRTTDAGSTWVGPAGLGAPTLAITLPTPDFSVGSPTISIQGTSADPGAGSASGIGVAAVQVALQRRSDSKYWNGSGWTSTQTWLSAGTSDEWDHWSASPTIDSTSAVAGGLIISARSRDGMGQYSVVKSVANFAKLATTLRLAKSSIVTAYGSAATVSGTLKAGATALAGKTVTLKKGSTVVRTTTTGSGGSFSFYFTPANVATTYSISYGGDVGYVASSATVKITPKAKVYTPTAPKTVKRYKYFKTYTYIAPKHATGATGATFYFYKYQKKSNGSYGYVLRKTISAKATNSSAYPTKSRATVTVKFPSGKWRVRAKHADSGHYTSYSSYKYFRVYK